MYIFVNVFWKARNCKDRFLKCVAEFLISSWEIAVNRNGKAAKGPLVVKN